MAGSETISPMYARIAISSEMVPVFYVAEVFLLKCPCFQGRG